MMYQQQQQQDIQMMNTPGYNPGYPPQQQQQQQQQPSAPPPYSQMPPSVPQEQIRENQFRDIVNRYEISLPFSSKLQKLNMFKIVFIFDDSGSMNATLEESPLNKGLIKATRWDELKYFSQISIDIANIFNQEAGTDVYFLNRPMARGVRSPDELVPYMVSRPNGYTPLARVLGTVLSNNSPQFLGEKKLLVIIVTDGEPTDDGGRSDIPGFKQCLQMRSNKTYTTIVSCTDEDDTMTYLNNWDRTIPRLDVVDDYRSEKEEILRANGRSYRFSFGDYVVKSLIGSIDPSLDNVDEVQHQSSECCTII